MVVIHKNILFTGALVLVGTMAFAKTPPTVQPAFRPHTSTSVDHPQTRVEVARPVSSVSVSHPTTVQNVLHPQTSVSVAQPATTTAVSRPQTNSTVSHPETTVQVVHPASYVVVPHPGEDTAGSLQLVGTATPPRPAGNTVPSSQASTSMSGYQPPKAKNFAAANLGGGDSGLGNKFNDAEKSAAAASFKVPEGEKASLEQVLKGSNISKAAITKKVEKEVK